LLAVHEKYLITGALGNCSVLLEYTHKPIVINQAIYTENCGLI